MFVIWELQCFKLFIISAHKYVYIYDQRCIAQHVSKTLEHMKKKKKKKTTAVLQRFCVIYSWFI